MGHVLIVHRIRTDVDVSTLLDGDHLCIDLVDDVVDLLARRGVRTVWNWRS